MKKTIGALVSTTLAISGLLAAPAQAAPDLILPANVGNGDFSGLKIVACDDAIHMTFPATSKAIQAFPFEAEYQEMSWQVTDFSGETETFDQYSGSGYLAKAANFQVSFVTPLNAGDEFIWEVTPRGYDATNQTWIDGSALEIPIEIVDETAFAGGSGTIADPYQIANVTQLNLVRCHQDKNFKLINDIDMNGVNWLPIGHYRDWRGNFDGNSHTIKNLTINELRNNVGLFGVVEHSAISDLTLENFNLFGDSQVGALAAVTRHSSFDNITVKNSTIAGRYQVGLLGGKADYRGNFTNIKLSGVLKGYPLFSRDNGPNDSYQVMQPLDKIGGALGYDDGDGTNWHNVDIDVEITADPVDYRVKNFLENSEVTSVSAMRRVGGFLGESGEQVSASDVDVRAKIHFNLGIPASFEHIAGVLGDSEESFFENINSDVSIDIKGANEFFDIGGFTGEADSATFSNIVSKAVMFFETGCVSYQPWDDTCSVNRKIGGFASDTQDVGIHDVKSTANITMIAGGEATFDDIGGFTGYDDETSLQRINSNANIKVLRGTPTNNSLGFDGFNLVAAELDSLGGFIGERDDYTSYRAISSTARIETDLALVERVGGFIGYSSETDPTSVVDAVIRGKVTVPSVAHRVGGFAGESGRINLRRVILSVELETNGATEDIAPVVARYYGGSEVPERSRLNNSFFNSNVMTQQPEFPLTSRTATQLRSAKFLLNNRFNLKTVFTHKEGQFPVVRLQGNQVDEVDVAQRGHINDKASLAVTKSLDDGLRKYLINLSSDSAREDFSLVVLRSGEVVKILLRQKTNGAGNFVATSNYELLVEDTLQVRIDKKVVAKLNIR